MSASPVYSISPGADESIISGQKDVTTAGTRVQLSSDTPRILEVLLQAKRTNTGRIYIGGSTVAADTSGVYLTAGQSVALSVTNLNKVYLDSSVNGEGVTYLATKE